MAGDGFTFLGQPTGTTAGTVATGNHHHAGADVDSGTVAYARLPVGTTASTIAAGDDARFVSPYAGDGTTLKLRPEGAADDDGELRITNAAAGTKLVFTDQTGGNADTNLYRSGAAKLATDSTLTVALGIELTRSTDVSVFNSFVSGDTQSRHRLAASGLHEWGAGGVSSKDTNLYRQGADQLATDDDFLIRTAGKGLQVKEGTNAKMGTATLVAGAATVSTTAVTANSRIFVTSQVDGGTPGWLRVSTRTAATSFVITSSSGTDTSTVAWIIFEPSA